MRRNGTQICLVNRSTKTRSMSAVLFDGLPCVAVMAHSTVQNHPHRGAAATCERLIETPWNLDAPALAAGIASPSAAAPTPYDGRLNDFQFRSIRNGTDRAQGGHHGLAPTGPDHRPGISR
jgi:hypothetical protein